MQIESKEESDETTLGELRRGKWAKHIEGLGFVVAWFSW
jgi:hypothetical protein